MEYLERIFKTLREISSREKGKIEEVSSRIAESISRGGIVFAFGTGHSHMIVEEMFYRAGGLVPVYPVLVSSLMLHEGGKRSSKLERIEGIGKAIFESLDVRDGDIVAIFSNSGVNAVPVEFAIEAKKRGIFTWAITSFDHSKSVPPRNSYGKRLLEVVDVAIDNHVPHGDASVEIDRFRVAPLSTIAGAFVVNSIVIGVVRILRSRGMEAPVFQSANVENGDEYNEKLIEIFSKRIPILR